MYIKKFQSNNINERLKIMIDDIMNLPTGRVDAEFISDDEVVVSWLSSFEGKGSLFLRKININGNQGEIKKIDDISELGISIFGNTFLTKEDGTFASSGIYSGTTYNYDEEENKAEKIVSPNCEANGFTLYVGYCGFIYGDRFNITNDESHNKIYLNASKSFDTYKLSSTFISSSINVNDNPQSPSYPALSFPEIGVGKAGSPFNKAVTWYGRPLAASSPSPLSPKEIDQFHFSSSLELNINEEDIFKLSLTHSEHENTMSRPDTISSRFTAALNNTGGPNSNLTWNLFDPSQNLSLIHI